MKSYYIILEREWIDKDGILSSLGDGGIPHYVFLDKESAEYRCFEFNKDMLEGLEFMAYGYDFIKKEFPHLILNAGKTETLAEELSFADVNHIMLFVGKYPFYFIWEIEA